jgi:hypothetical protein
VSISPSWTGICPHAAPRSIGFSARRNVEARTLQLQGTPGFVIGHSLVPGALSLEDLEHLVAQAKDKK